MASQPIDLATWPRRDYFYYFTKMMPTAYSITVDIDVTATTTFLKHQHLKFFPTYLYLATKLLADQPEFLVGTQDGQLVQYDQLNPSFSLFHEDDHTISNLWLPFNASYKAFYTQYGEATQRYQNQHGAMVQSAPAPANSYMIGTIPWVSFNNYTPIPMQPLTSYAPIIQSGKFKVVNGRQLMPLSFTIHHAVADGYHVSRYLNRLEAAFARPAQYLS